MIKYRLGDFTKTQKAFDLVSGRFPEAFVLTLGRKIIFQNESTYLYIYTLQP